MRAHVTLSLIFAILANALVTSSRALAQSDEATEHARRHFAQGVELYDAKPPKYEAALAHFRAAYEDKPSPGIKRNIALCLKGLARYPEAMDALDEMLAEGGDTLKPEVRAGAVKTLAEMNDLVASLRITPRLDSPAAVTIRPPVELWLDEKSVPIAKTESAIRVMPGEHRLRARAVGYIDAVRAVNVAVAQHDVVVLLNLVPLQTAGIGRLSVTTNVNDASIAIDHVGLARGQWAGDVGTGTHQVDVTAADYEPYDADVYVAPNETRDLRVELHAMARLRPPGPKATAMPARRWFILFGGSVQAESLTLAKDVFEEADDTRRGFGGFTLILKGGRKLGPYAALDVLAEIGGFAAKYKSPNPSVDSKITVTNFSLAPGLQFRGLGSVRMVGGLAAGLAWQSTDATLGEVAGPATKVHGAGFGGVGMFDVGAQFDFTSRAYIEATLFGDVHGVATASDSTGRRLYLDSPTIRGGLRVLVGYDL